MHRGVGNMLGRTGGVVGETIDRVAITVKDVSRSAGELYSDAVKTSRMLPITQPKRLAMPALLLRKPSRISQALSRKPHLKNKEREPGLINSLFVFSVYSRKLVQSFYFLISGRFPIIKFQKEEL